MPTIEPYGDIREYATKLFENNGRGIGQKGKDNGLLILLAVKERRVWIEVGYGLEQWITDGFAGETSREVMTPEFRQGRYGEGCSPAPSGSSAASRRAATSRSTGVERAARLRPGARSCRSRWLRRHLHRHPDHQPDRRRPGRGVRRWGAAAGAAGRAASGRSAAAGVGGGFGGGGGLAAVAGSAAASAGSAAASGGGGGGGSSW